MLRRPRLLWSRRRLLPAQRDDPRRRQGRQPAQRTVAEARRRGCRGRGRRGSKKEGRSRRRCRAVDDRTHLHEFEPEPRLLAPVVPDRGIVGPPGPGWRRNVDHRGGPRRCRQHRLPRGRRARGRLSQRVPRHHARRRGLERKWEARSEGGSDGREAHRHAPPLLRVVEGPRLALHVFRRSPMREHGAAGLFRWRYGPREQLYEGWRHRPRYRHELLPAAAQPWRRL
mmetsp:Transcript_56849/g.158323  ORF Transcript_56849/g.158323 Transcript_56849/m.158323 type:complete len:227 (-) Transcript_56849:1172-1852(-)